MLKAVFIAVLIASFGSATRISLPGYEDFNSLQIASKGYAEQLNVSQIAQSNKVTYASQTSLLDASPTLKRAYAQEAVLSSSNEDGGEPVEGDPFPMNEGNHRPFRPAKDKIIRGTNGSRYKYLKEIDHGYQGLVWSAASDESSTPDVVIKTSKMTKGRMSSKMVANWLREVKYLDMLSKSEHIVHMKDSFKDGAGFYYIVLEYMAGGSLFNKVLAGGSINDDTQVHNLFVDVLEGLKDMHNREIAHLDIKLQNVLLTADGKRAKLCDLGFSSSISSSHHRGTPGYLAPEMFSEKAFDASKVDIFALGVTLYTMVMGSPPFDPDDRLGERSSRHGYGELQATWLKEREKDVDTDLIDVIQCMLEKNPAERCSISEIQNKPWFKKESSTATVQSSRKDAQ